ncbi:MAG: GGDEF domain-containing protein [Pseudomonas sp.]|nr:GGDEF domain-containing protein [Pseudomonas sp.]
MQNDALPWKEKYFELLDKQEELELLFNAQIDLLKRGLVRSSLAAEGNDEQLDANLQELRKLLRKSASNTELEIQINSLEKAVIKSEEKSNNRKAAITEALASFSEQLQQLQPPKEVQRALKSFEKNLTKKIAQPYSLYPLLCELKALQQQTLQATINVGAPTQATAQGLLARLFKINESAASASNTQSTPPEPDFTADNQAVLTSDERNPLVEQVSTDTQPLADAVVNTQSNDHYALPQLIEPTYSSVAKHIHDTLIALLNDLPIIRSHEQQILALRARINNGLNWYELAPLLDELSIIILAIANGGQNELEQYLLQLNNRLISFHENLQATSQGYQASAADAQALDNDLRQHVSNIQSDVQTSKDLNDLKKLVEIRLDGFIESLQTYQEKRMQSESDILVRFQALAEHSQQMEHEAQQLTDKLEEQRQKALLDPLTGMANRAALNERSELEYARIQRNNSSLLLTIIDIDYFKRINDSYGHLAGDKVLKIIAQELSKRLRKTDFIARFGGEEFVILLPETPLMHGKQLLETLRLAIEACPFHFRGEPVTITFSAGIGQVSPKESLEEAFERIDQSLYAAKKAGRNTVIVAAASKLEQPES